MSYSIGNLKLNGGSSVTVTAGTTAQVNVTCDQNVIAHVRVAQLYVTPGNGTVNVTQASVAAVLQWSSDILTQNQEVNLDVAPGSNRVIVIMTDGTTTVSLLISGNIDIKFIDAEGAMIWSGLASSNLVKGCLGAQYNPDNFAVIDAAMIQSFSALNGSNLSFTAIEVSATRTNIKGVVSQSSINITQQDAISENAGVVEAAGAYIDNEGYVVLPSCALSDGLIQTKL